MKRIEDHMKRIERWLTVLTGFLDIIGGWVVLPLISTLVLIDVILRYVFNAPFIWTLEFNEWALLLVFAFAIPECTRRHGHIRMDLVYGQLRPRVRRYLSVVYCVLAAWLFFLLGRHAWDEFLYDYQFDRVTEFLALPVWLHQLAILAMSAIIIVYFVLRAVCDVLDISAFTEEDAAEFIE